MMFISSFVVEKFFFLMILLLFVVVLYNLFSKYCFLIWLAFFVMMGLLFFNYMIDSMEIMNSSNGMDDNSMLYDELFAFAEDDTADNSKKAEEIRKASSMHRKLLRELSAGGHKVRSSKYPFSLYKPESVSKYVPFTTYRKLAPVYSLLMQGDGTIYTAHHKDVPYSAHWEYYNNFDPNLPKVSQDFFKLLLKCESGEFHYYDEDIGEDSYVCLHAEPEVLAGESEYENGKRKSPLPKYLFPGIPMPPQSKNDGCEWTFYDMDVLSVMIFFFLMRFKYNYGGEEMYYFTVFAHYNFEFMVKMHATADMMWLVDEWCKLEEKSSASLISYIGDGGDLGFMMMDPNHPGYHWSNEITHKVFLSNGFTKEFLFVLTWVAWYYPVRGLFDHCDEYALDMYKKMFVTEEALTWTERIIMYIVEAFNYPWF